MSSAHSCFHTSVRKKRAVSVKIPVLDRPCHAFMRNDQDLDPIVRVDCDARSRFGFIGSNRVLILSLGEFVLTSVSKV